MARAKPIPGIEPGARFGDAAASAVEVRTGEVFGFAEGVLDTDDVERVHDMRVATRRLRAVMEIFAPCFPRKKHKRALKEVKALADALGARRDPDVAIEMLEAIAQDVPGADIDALVAQLREEQSAANDHLAESLREVKANRLHERLLALAEAAR